MMISCASVTFLRMSFRVVSRSLSRLKTGRMIESIGESSMGSGVRGIGVACSELRADIDGDMPELLVAVVLDFDIAGVAMPELVTGLVSGIEIDLWVGDVCKGLEVVVEVVMTAVDFCVWSDEHLG